MVPVTTLALATSSGATETNRHPDRSVELSGGQSEQECRAVGEFAFGADGAAVGQHDVFGDSQAEAGASGFAGAGFVDAIETLEQAGQVFGTDACAEILDIEFNAVFRAPLRGVRAERDAFSRATVLHRVFNQVGKDLMNRLAVGENQRQGFGGRGGAAILLTSRIGGLPTHDLQFHSLSAGGFSKTLFCIVQQLDGRHRLDVEASLAGFHAGQG